MRIVLSVVAVLLLSGCTDAPTGGAEVIVLSSGDDGESDPEYSFVLFGEAYVEDGAREVTIRVYDGGAVPRDFVEYNAEPGAVRQTLRVYLLTQPYVQFDVIADQNVVAHGSIDISECPTPDSDAIVEVMDRKVTYGDRSVRVDYGCSG